MLDARKVFEKRQNVFREEVIGPNDRYLPPVRFADSGIAQKVMILDVQDIRLKCVKKFFDVEGWKGCNIHGRVKY